MKISVASVALAFAAVPATAGVITPVSVTASDTFSFFGQYKPENLINGSGLTNELHDGTFSNMWQTNLGVNQATVTFEFAGTYSLAEVAIWNYNFGNPAEFQSTILRGVKDFRLLASIDGTNFATILEGRLALGTGQPLAAERFETNGARARFLRIDILNNYAQGTFAERDWNSGLSEVRFNAVPEPASWAMMIGGFGMAGAALRRRSARVRFA